MTDLTDFLLARIAEDEAAARACAEAFPPPWDVNDRGQSAMVSADAPNFWPVSQIDQEQETPGRWPGEHLEHIARHDPARVLAECAAKRRIVELHPAMPSGRWCDVCSDTSGPYAFDDETELVAYPCPTVRALASVYADHAGFREEWL